jgi:hypothetical protein
MKSLMCSTIGCILLVAISLSIAAPRGQAAGDEFARVRSLENAWNQAEVKHDARALSMLLAETFEFTDDDGHFMNKTQWLAHIRNAVDHYEQLGNSGMAVHLYGNVAVATGIYQDEDKRERKDRCAFRSFYRYLDSAEWRVEVRGEPSNPHQLLGTPKQHEPFARSARTA